MPKTLPKIKRSTSPVLPSPTGSLNMRTSPSGYSPTIYNNKQSQVRTPMTGDQLREAIKKSSH